MGGGSERVRAQVHSVLFFLIFMTCQENVFPSVPKLPKINQRNFVTVHGLEFGIFPAEITRRITRREREASGVERLGREW